METNILSSFASQQAASGGNYFQKWRIFDNQGCGWRNLVPYRPIYGHIGPYGTHRINIWPYIPQIWPDGMSGPVRMWCPARMWRPDAKSGPDVCFCSTKSRKMRSEISRRTHFSKVRYLCSEVDSWKNSSGTLLRISMYCGRNICQSYLCKDKAYAYKMCASRFREFFLRSPGTRQP